MVRNKKRSCPRSPAHVQQQRHDAGVAGPGAHRAQRGAQRRRPAQSGEGGRKAVEAHDDVRRCATSRLAHARRPAHRGRRPGRATAAQPRQVTSPWRDGPLWSAIDGQPPRAWMSMPLRGRMWYFDYVHYTGAARTLGAAVAAGVACVARRTMRWRREATLCSRVSVSVGVLYACVCTRSAPAFRASLRFRLNIFSVASNNLPTSALDRD
jgi:hypothetical protein